MKRWGVHSRPYCRWSVVPRSAIASTATATKSSSPALPAPGPAEVYYFAYGSNMCPTVLTGRRKVQPRASAPCLVPGYELRFNMLGLPYAEPAFASIEPVGSSGASSFEQPEVHGVVHLISQREWAAVQRTEGVTASQELGYQVLPVRCRLYCGREVQALTLQGRGLSCHPGSRSAMPSARYLGLLRNGAKHHGVDPAYRQYLDGLQAYDSSAWQSKAGGGFATLALLGFFGPLLPLFVAFRAQPPPPAGSAEPEPQAPEWVSACANAAIRACWGVHDLVLQPVFGSGAASGSGSRR